MGWDWREKAWETTEAQSQSPQSPQPTLTQIARAIGNFRALPRPSLRGGGPTRNWTTSTLLGKEPTSKSSDSKGMASGRP